MLKIQEVIKKFDNIEIANYFLMSKLNLSIRKDILVGNNNENNIVYIYNYTENTPKHDPIGMWARGLILDYKADVVSQSFPRFFDLGETHYGLINWNGATVEELENGIFMNIYFAFGKWHMQTRRSANGDEVVRFSKYTTRLTCKQWADSILAGRFSMEWDDALEYGGGDRDLCYAFELVIPKAKIVTDYDYADMILLSILDKSTGMELSTPMVDEIANELQLARPGSARVRCLADVSENLKGQCETDAGLVIVDGNGKRIRLRNMQHIAATDNLNNGVDVKPEYFIDLIRSGSDTLAAKEASEYEEFIDFLKEEIEALTHPLKFFHAQLKHVTSKKKFADTVKDLPLKQILFDLQSGDITDVEEGIASISSKKLISAIKKAKEAKFNRLFNDILKLERKVLKMEEG